MNGFADPLMSLRAVVRPFSRGSNCCPGTSRSAYGWLVPAGVRPAPRRFPIVQFPNLPLIIAFVAGQAAGVHGAQHPYLASVAYLAMTVWAYEELVHGVNWFRHLLGLTYAVILVMRVAQALQ